MSESDSTRNHLLALLTPDDRARIAGTCESVTLTLQQNLSQLAGGIAHVYFPVSGMISLVPGLEYGTPVEVGLIGREGFLGVPLLLSGQASPISAIVQATGTALRMPAAAFLAEAEGNAAFRSVMMRYAQSLMIQITRTAICNCSHTLPHRLGRWLLEAHDRAESDDLPLSHKFLSMMLGSRRAGITVALGALSTAGHVTLTHGMISILNRKGIEASACECYRRSQAESARIFPANDAIYRAPKEGCTLAYQVR